MSQSLNKFVMDFDAFKMFEDLENPTDSDIIEVKGIVSKLMFDDAVGIFSEKDMSTEYASTMTGNTNLDDFKKINGIGADESLAGKHITKIRITEPIEPFDPDVKASEKKAVRELAETESENALVKHMDKSEQDRYAKAGGKMEKLAILNGFRTEYIKQNQPEVYADYQELANAMQAVRQAPTDTELLKRYVDMFDLKIPTPTDKKVISELKDLADAKLLIADAELISGEPQEAQDSYANSHKAAGILKRIDYYISLIKDNNDKPGEGIKAVEQKLQSLSKNDIADILVQYVKLPQEGALKIASSDKGEAVQHIISYILNEIKMEHDPSKIGAVKYRSSVPNKYVANHIVTLNIPQAVFNKSIGKYVIDSKASVSLSGDKDIKSYDPETGIIELTRPITIPENNVIGQNRAEALHLTNQNSDEYKRSLKQVYEPSYVIKKQIKKEPIDKPFLKEKTVGEEEKLQYEPAVGMPKSVKVMISQNDWEHAPEIGDEISNTSKSGTIAEEQAADLVGDMSDDEFAKAYANAFRGPKSKPADIAKKESDALEAISPDKTPDALENRKKLAGELVKSMIGNPDAYRVILKSADKSKTGEDYKGTFNYWIKFDISVEDMSEFDKSIEVEKAKTDYAASKKEEINSPSYKLMYKDTSEMNIDQLKDLYSKITGKSADEAAAYVAQNGMDRFRSEVTWLAYNDDVAEQYAKSFNVTKEDALNDLKTNRSKAIRRFATIKTEKEEKETVPPPQEIGIDPLSGKKVYKLHPGMKGEKMSAWSKMNADNFISGDDVRSKYMEKGENGEYVKSDEAVEEMYNGMFDNKGEDAKRLSEFDNMNDGSLAAKYARAKRIDREKAMDAVRSNKADVIRELKDRMRTMMVDAVADQTDEDLKVRRGKVKIGPMYRELKSREELAKTYQELNPEITEEEALSIIDSDEEAIEDMKRTGDAYKISNERMAEAYSKMAGIGIKQAYDEIMQGRDSIVNKMVSIDAGSKTGTMEPTEKQTKYAASMEERRSRLSKNTALVQLRSKLEETTDAELKKQYAYLYQPDAAEEDKEVVYGREMPEDRDDMIDDILEMKEKMLAVKFKNEQNYKQLYKETEMARRAYNYKQELLNDMGKVQSLATDKLDMSPEELAGMDDAEIVDTLVNKHREYLNKIL